MISFLCTGMYGCASMSATSLRLGSTLMAFFFTAIGILCVWVYMEMDFSVLVAAAGHSKLMKQLVAIAQSDWTKALAVGSMGGPIIVVLVLNRLTNSLRKCKGAAGDSANDAYTPACRGFLTHVDSFNWTGIFLKICLLGELFFTMQVGVAKLTYIFLSWLNVTLAETSLAVV